MKITADLFADFLKCPTKCHLRSLGEAGTGNEYAEWMREQNDRYRKDATSRLLEAVPEAARAFAPPSTENLKATNWRLAVDVVAQTERMEARLQAVERVATQGRGKATRFVPIRLIPNNKLARDDKLLLAFDALVLSEVLGRKVAFGKIIHGDDHATQKVNTVTLAGQVRKLMEMATALCSNKSPPDLILNRHCGECEFRDRCRQKTVEKDDLSLLSNMSEKERKKFNSEGIFTVIQLSYTFRPRRRPKRLRDKPERYHHALKALAIREKKIHIVGTPELKIDGTPVFLDVEGLPDREFYYLIGLRIKTSDGVVQHSFWADDLEGEKKAWGDFLAAVAVIERPVLVHYGSFETAFLRRMSERYGGPPEGSMAANAIKSAINLISVIYAQIYFPAYSNGLKDIAGYLGFVWSMPNPSGLTTIMWRHSWETMRSSGFKERLINYNAEDCQALETVTLVIARLCSRPLEHKQEGSLDHPVVHTELLPQKTMWPKFSSPLMAFELANRAARWDYQRDRIYVRSSKRIRRLTSKVCRVHRRPQKINQVIVISEKPPCPKCGRTGNEHCKLTKMILHDLRFGNGSVRKWVVEYRFPLPWCGHCHIRYGLPRQFWPRANCGQNLSAYVIYQCVELYVPQQAVQRTITRLFGLHFGTCAQIHRLKARAADFYRETQRLILDRIVKGSLVHVDETRANIQGRTAWVWVFTNLHEVTYLYSDSRESETAKTILGDFQGVLVSDFYSGYDSLPCPQQRCLLHLLRDLNADILHHPYDEELKRIVTGFAQVLKEVVDTVDRFGLKKHFLHKHQKSVARFYRQLESADVQSQPALKCKERFEKNRCNLFTFLDYDGVPWNNNNAEHAIKAFASLRSVIGGSSTRKGTEDYLVLLSVCQTCKYSGLDFLDFLRSGEKDIDAFAQKQGGRRRSAPIEPF